MNDQKIKLLSLDIDGTLYPHKAGPVNPYHTVKLCKRFEKLKDLGIYLALCTGKTMTYCEAIVERYNLFSTPNYDNWHVLENGVLVMDYKHRDFGGWPPKFIDLPKTYGNSEIWDVRNRLENEILTQLPGTEPEIGKTSTISLANKNYDVVEAYNIIKDLIEDSGYRVCGFEEQDILKNDVDRIIGALIGGVKEDHLKQIIGNLNYDFYITYTPTAVDIVPYPFGKSLALMYLARLKNIGPHEIIAFGDSPGDHSVFEAISPGGIPFALKPKEVTKDFVKSLGGYQLKRKAPLGVIDTLDCVIECEGKMDLFKQLIRDKKYVEF